MTKWNSWKGLIVGAAVALFGLLSAKANAANTYTSSATLNIDVTINASAEVAIDGAGASTSTAVSWNPATQISASGDLSSTATVTNPGNLVERWYLSANNAEDLGSGGAWTISESTNITDEMTDTFAILAVFASSATTAAGCPASNAAIWGSTSTVVTACSPSLGNCSFTQGNAGNAYGAAGAGPNYQNNVYVGQNILGASSCPDTGCGANNYQMLPNTATPTGSGKRALCWKIIEPKFTDTTDEQVIPLTVWAGQL